MTIGFAVNTAVLDESLMDLEEVMPDSKLLWRNLLAQDGVTVSSTQDPTNLINLYDNLTTQFWNIDGAGTFDVVIDLPAPVEINAVGVAGDTWASSGTVINVFVGPDPGTKVADVSGIPNGKPHMLTFTPFTTNRIVVQFVTTGPLNVTQLSVGRTLDFPKGPSIGMELGKFNNTDALTSQSTEGNAFAGSSTQPRSRPNSIPFRAIPISWIRSDWIPFSDEHRGKLVWMVWDATGHPNDVMFGNWRTTSAVGYTSSLVSDINLEIVGLVR